MLFSAATHIHSTWSYDGKWELADLALEFRRRGYRMLLMTEHDRGFSASRLAEFRAACARASDESLLVVPGIEYSDAENRIHVLTWGPVPFLGEGRDTEALLRAVTDAGGVSVFAHPSRREAWKFFQPAWRAYLTGVEVWNRKTDGWAPSPHAGEFVTTQCAPFVGMDFHTKKQLFPLAMLLEMPGEPTESSVLESLRHRACRPLAFRRPLARVETGPLRFSLRISERMRRLAARSVRRLFR